MKITDDEFIDNQSEYIVVWLCNYYKMIIPKEAEHQLISEIAEDIRRRIRAVR